jgi:signal transduction histidine kinase
MRLVLSLRTWLVGSHLVVLVLPVLVLVLSGALASDLVQQTEDDLRHQGALVGLLASTELGHARQGDSLAEIADVAAELHPALVAVRDTTLSGVRVLDRAGVVVATSGTEIGEDLSQSPEVAEALEGETGATIRPRPPQSERQPLTSASRRALVRLFVATPISVDGQVVGVVLVSRTPREELQALYRLVPRWGALLTLAATLSLGLYSGWLFSRSLKQLAAASHRLAEGSLSSLGDLSKPERSHVREVGALAAAVSTMATRLQARLLYISEFAGNVSHEFRTPISTLRGTIELLRDDDDMPAEQRARFLDNALADLERMDRLVTGLLALARAEESGGQRRLSLAALIATFASRHPEIALDGEGGEVHGNPEQLDSALENMIGNARRHGGSQVAIRVVGWQDATRTGFDVLDDGIGISPANQLRIFDRFFTTDRHQGGTGLGLALVRAVCTAHGGTVEVESRPGATRFRVSLPRASPS